MKTKNNPPIELLKGIDVSYLVEFYYELNQIKQLYRQGWLKRGIPEEKCESVGDHSYATAVLAWMIAQEYNLPLDISRALPLILIHDLPEVIKGDPTPHDGIPEHEKLRGETEAMEHLFRNFRDPERYISLWQEYAEQSTPEARFVKQIDRLEMALQASVYERQHGKDLSDFFLDVKTKLHEPVLKGILEEIILIRGR